MSKEVELLQSKCEKLVRENDANWTRFNYNQCWFSEPCIDETGVYVVLKSYNTYVALIDLTHNTFCELGKYSVTTSKHVTQFYNKYYSNFKRILKK